MGRPVVGVLGGGGEIALLQILRYRLVVVRGQHGLRGPLHLGTADRDQHLHALAVLGGALPLVLLGLLVPLPGDVRAEREEVGPVPGIALQDPFHLGVEEGATRAAQRLDLRPIVPVDCFPLVLRPLPGLGLAALQEVTDGVGVAALQCRPGGLADLFLLIELGEVLDELTVTVGAQRLQCRGCRRGAVGQRAHHVAQSREIGRCGRGGGGRRGGGQSAQQRQGDEPGQCLGNGFAHTSATARRSKSAQQGEPPENENSDRPERNGGASGQAVVTRAWRCPSPCVPGPGAAPARSPASGPVDVGVSVLTVSRRLYGISEGEGIRACGSGDRVDFAGRDHPRPNNGAAPGSEGEMGTTGPGRSCRSCFSPCGSPLPSACTTRRSAMTPVVPLPACRPSRSAASP